MEKYSKKICTSNIQLGVLIKMENNKKILGEPSTNIWYHNDTLPDNWAGPEVSRNTEVLKDQSLDDGNLYKTNLNLVDDARGNNPRQSEAKGMLKLDKKNPIWKYDDELIKEVLVKKLQEKYMYVEPKGLNVDIDRNEGIINYEYQGNKYTGIKSYKIISDEDDIELVEVFFEDLKVQETFYIDPQKMESNYKNFYESDDFKKVGKFSRDTEWQKTSATTFCLFTEGTKCVKTEIKFYDVTIGSVFNINPDGLRADHAPYYGYIKQQMGRDPVESDKFQKIDDTHYIFIEGGKKLSIKQPEKMPVLFVVFLVEVDQKVAPPSSIALAEVPIGSIFVFTTAAVNKTAQGKIKPGTTQFIKMTSAECFIYNPANFDEEAFGSHNFDEVYEAMQFNSEEEIEKALLEDQIKTELKKRREKAQKQAFIIDENIIPEANNWGGRHISAGSYVLVLDKKQFAVKKSTMNTFIESLFSKFETTKDEKGEYIIISPVELEAGLSDAKLDYTDWDKLTRNETIKMPTGEYDEKDGKKTPIMQDFDTKVGNTDKYYWVMDKDGNWIINK